jgi:tRNA pseudouridine32 synthase/23S rRNA pseudouridine746 synthase
MVQPELDCFIRFKTLVDARPLPEHFTNPFYYQPHPLCINAAQELQAYLQEQQDWSHPFGIDPDPDTTAYGKMFGVLVVQNTRAEIGYLAAFSGKIAGQNHHKGFVPPVFDILDETGFYRRGEEELNALNRQIAQLEQQATFVELQKALERAQTEAEAALTQQKTSLQAAKQARQVQREQPDITEATLAALIEESKRDHFILKDLKRHWKAVLDGIQQQLQTLTDELNDLKNTRKSKSANLQQDIFDHYYFLNQAGEQKSLADIFQNHAGQQPPAGAGECAAPKLLQYAFKHHLKPIAMAEFWWGESPVGEIRKHGHFYPACRGKCAPILEHMLEGIPLEPLPLMGSATHASEITILFEDAHLLVINKPPGLLSVPGKEARDSVFLWIKRRCPEATGPLIVHRLDMATSGLMVLAKTTAVYKQLQSQFIQRSIQKRYEALLDGNITKDAGVIDLPLRVDLDDRPRQMVCYTYGKSARTEWKVIARTDKHTRVHFFPVTGRTHQLRVHAAHPNGLNAPIVGDDLYGQSATRLCLHAASLAFIHPVSGEKMVLEVACDF